MIDRIHSGVVRGGRGEFVLLLVLALAASAAGEQPSVERDLIRMREQREQPWLQIQAGGHTAAVRALAYTPDGKRLCSAGLDKMVQVWNLSAVGRDLRRTYLRERTIRWQVARGLRGSIYALASSPSDGLLAIGGYGAMGSLGEILLVNAVDGSLEKVLQGHRQTVCSLAFSSDGNWLASSDVGGQVIAWRRGQWQPQTLYEPDKKTYDPQLAELIQTQSKLRPVAIAGNTAVIVPASIGRQPDGQLGWKLQVVSLANPKEFRTLDALHSGMVSALATSSDGTWLASADLTGHLYLWNLKTAEEPVTLRPEAAILSLAFSPDAKTLVAGSAVVPAKKESKLQVWDLATKTLKRSRSLPDHVSACAVSPDGRDVSYVGGKDNEVLIERLDAPGKAVALKGSGRRVLKVAFAREQPFYRIAIGTELHERGFNDYADLQETFDLVRLEAGRIEQPRSEDWLSADWGRGNWNAKLQADGSLQLYRDNATQGKVVLDRNREGKPRCFTWIANEKGEPFAIAVGTDVQNSVFVYRLAGAGQCPILRHLRGHHDYVTSLSVSRDLRYLASASADGTVIVWSLALLDQGAELIGRWGAEFAVQGDQLVAANVHPAGPLSGKGMRSGDALTQIRWNDGQAEQRESRPAAIVERLGKLPWGTQVVFDFTRQGAERSFQLLPAWQPLATLFVNADREWAFWSPQGYYSASINGYTMFGWQVNRGLASLPDFYRADQFRKRLERPEVMEQLLPAGSLEQAFEAARQKPPAEAQRVLPAQIAATPRVEILSPRPGEIVPKSVLRLRARIVMPGDGKLLEAKVYANGVVAARQPLVNERKLEQGREMVYDWEVYLPSDPRNLIELIVGTDAPTAAFSNVLIERPPAVRPERPPRLFVLATGINEYRDPAIQPLSFAVADAETITQTLQERAKGLYAVERAVILKNSDVTPQKWRKAFEEICGDLKKQAQPDDLLVLFFAGHGFLAPQTNHYYYVGHDFPVSGLETGDYSDCIAWQDFRLLADVPCRKLVLLDTCHSGAIQPLRARSLTAAVRLLQEDVIFTFAASAGNERSAENKGWGHGAFTKCLLEVLRDSDRRASDPVLTLNEAVDYVGRGVTKLTGGGQNPVAAPDELLPFTSVRLVRRD